jgi:hypothetical protein
VGSNSYRQIAADLRSIDQLDLMVANSCSQRACTFSVSRVQRRDLARKNWARTSTRFRLLFGFGMF